MANTNPEHPAKLCIAVTGLNANDNPGPGIAVARALRDAFAKTLSSNLRLIGLAYENLEPGIYLTDVIHKTYKIPYPASGKHALLERLKYIQDKENIDILIPNFDAELGNFIKIADELKKIGIKTFLPSLQQLDARDKINLKKFGDQHALHVPNDFLAGKEDELEEVAENFGYPLVIKGKFYEAHIAQHINEAKKIFHKLSAKWGFPVIIQKHVQGTEINIAGLGDGNGNLASVVAMRKLYITDKGKAWAGITVEDDAFVDIAKKFAQATCWKGGFEMEIIKNEQNELYVIEINPRFPAWIYLTVAAGQNQPEMLCDLIWGKPVSTATSYQSGKMFIRYAWDNIVDVAEFQKIAAFGEL